MNLRFTIVIPCLNAGLYLERALQSVLVQAGEDTEVIVIDGGSTDGSVAVIEKYAALSGGERFGEGGECANEQNFRTLELSNSRTLFHWCSEPDNGQSDALNKGFAKAHGNYLFWVNADDLLLPGTLECARNFLDRHPGCPWLAGNLVYIDEADRVLWCARDGRWRDVLYRHAPVRVYGPTSIFRRDLFEQVGGFDTSLHYVMDTDLWLRFRNAGVRFERLTHYCWAFRVHGHSKTSGDLLGGTDPRMAEEQKRMYAKNGVVVTRSGLWQQQAWRLLNGCYLRAWFDTQRYGGRSIAAAEWSL